MVYKWSTSGLQVVYKWSTIGIHMVNTSFVRMVMMVVMMVGLVVLSVSRARCLRKVYDIYKVASCSATVAARCHGSISNGTQVPPQRPPAIRGT